MCFILFHQLKKQKTHSQKLWQNGRTFCQLLQLPSTSGRTVRTVFHIPFLFYSERNGTVRSVRSRSWKFEKPFRRNGWNRTVFKIIANEWLKFKKWTLLLNCLFSFKFLTENFGASVILARFCEYLRTHNRQNIKGFTSPHQEEDAKRVWDWQNGWGRKTRKTGNSRLFLPSHLTILSSSSRAFTINCRSAGLKTVKRWITGGEHRRSRPLTSAVNERFMKVSPLLIGSLWLMPSNWGTQRARWFFTSGLLRDEVTLFPHLSSPVSASSAWWATISQRSGIVCTEHVLTSCNAQRDDRIAETRLWSAQLKVDNWPLSKKIMTK